MPQETDMPPILIVLAVVCIAATAGLTVLFYRADR